MTTFTLPIPDGVAARLATLPTEKRDALNRELAATIADALRQVELEEMRRHAQNTKPTEPPAWLAELQAKNPPTDGTNGLHRVLGAWPGEETDEEINEWLEKLS